MKAAFRLRAATLFQRGLGAAALAACCCGPAYAAQPGPAAGSGPYDGFGLDGPAGATVRRWLHDTVVDCGRSDSPGMARCRLDGITSSLSIHYVGPASDPLRTAVAFVSDNPDSGNIYHGVVGLWRREGATYVGGRAAISDDAPVGEPREVDGVVSYEAEALRFMPAVEPAIHRRLRLVDDGQRLRTERVGPERVVPEGPPVVLAPVKPVPITPDVETHGADLPVRRLLALGDGSESVFFPRRGQPDRMSEFLSKGLIDAWKAAMPAMKAAPVLDGNPVTATQDTSGLRLSSLALSYHEGRTATLVATVQANVGGDIRTFPIDFNVLDEDGAWRIANIKAGRDGASLFSVLTAIADDWKRQRRPAAAASPTADPPPNIADAGMTLAEPRYRGEWGLTFDHNGSEVAAFPRAGLVAYVRPKASLAGTVRPGDVVYRGSLTGRLSGTAYVFRAGCAPAPYRVAGAWARPGAIDFGFTLRGRSPVRDGGSCSVRGYSTASSNAVLRFESALDAGG